MVCHTGNLRGGHYIGYVRCVDLSAAAAAVGAHKSLCQSLHTGHSGTTLFDLLQTVAESYDCAEAAMTAPGFEQVHSDSPGDGSSSQVSKACRCHSSSVYHTDQTPA